MKAIVYQRYGEAHVLKVADVPKPKPKENEVLVKIHQSLVTPTDIAGRTGRPWIIRLFTGLFRPKVTPGSDFAGEIEAVGAAVIEFKPGDRVFGATKNGNGTNAQYLCMAETDVLISLPSEQLYEETAGLCDAAMTAYSFLKEETDIQPSQKILINGASGAVGTYAIQLAKYFGAEVTAVCSAKNVALVQSLGADQVIDYTQVDFTQIAESYDIVFDAVGKSTFPKCSGILKEGGIYMTTVPTFAILWQMLWTAFFGKKRAKFAATGLNQTKEKLRFLLERVRKGDIKAVIDRSYAMKEIVAAHQYVEKGHKVGNVILEIDHPNSQEGQQPAFAEISTRKA